MVTLTTCEQTFETQIIQTISLNRMWLIQEMLFLMPEGQMGLKPFPS